MKYKKIICFISTMLLLILMIIVPLGCSDSGYKIIRSIEYTTNGKTQKQSSSCSTHYGAYIPITKEKYETSPRYKVLDKNAFNGPSLISVSKEAKGATHIKVDAIKKQEDDDLERYYQTYDIDNKIWRYYVTHEMYYDYYFVYVKVVNSTTIIVRDNKGDTTYTVTSYRITDFE